MKKAPLIISIVALLGVILLFIQQNSSSAPKKVNKKNDSEIVNLAYVKLDTLIEAYHFYNTKKTELMVDGQSKQQDLEARYKSLQRRAYEIQSQVQNRMMTPTRAQKKQEVLAREEQQIMMDKQTYELQIMEANQDLMKQILDSVKNYVKIYNEDYGFDLVITNDTLGSTVLYAQDQMDITSDIIEGLNARYNGGEVSDDKSEDENKEK